MDTDKLPLHGWNPDCPGLPPHHPYAALMRGPLDGLRPDITGWQQDEILHGGVLHGGVVRTGAV